MPRDKESIQHLAVRGLFGYLDHEINFRTGAVTILTGPNGSGKTQILRLLNGMLSLDAFNLFKVPFASAQLTFASGRRLLVLRDVDREAIMATAWPGGVEGYSNDPLGHYVFDLNEIRSRLMTGKRAPGWLYQVGPDEWYDESDSVQLSTAEVRDRYPDLFEVSSEDVPDWLEDFRLLEAPTFIETGRLDQTGRTTAATMKLSRSSMASRRAPSSAVSKYVEQIVSQMRTAKAASLSVSQQADRQFASRALDRARDTVRESELRGQYERIAALHQSLHMNGLTEESIDVEFPPGRTNPTERRIINVFLEDWISKLAPLLPVHRKLEVLRRIVDEKMRDKVMRISPEGELTFHSRSGQRVSPEHLSSGEQHMLALFAMLLFQAAPDSVVLIDEPEISLHAAWKHGFLEDLALVGEQVPSTVVLATHSTALINSRWDLVEELQIPNE